MKLVWTKEKPQVQGWYWVKADHREANIRLFMPYRGYHLMGHHLQPVDGPLSTLGWMWFAGPIPEPKIEMGED